MQQQVLDILALSETRLDSTASDSEITIEGYTAVRRDRARNGGGVALYIRNTTDFQVRNNLSDNNIEFLCVEIKKPKSKHFLLSAWYRPPSSAVELFEKCEVLLDKIVSENMESTIIGNLMQLDIS